MKQDPAHLHYRVTWPKSLVTPLTPPSSSSSTGHSTPDVPAADDTEDLLKNYFNLHHNLAELYKQWADADPNFRKRAPQFTGVRILNQDAWEALVGFICSSNNNISRISQMVHKLCLHYGPYIGTIAGEPFHDFPTPKSLTAPGVESHLRELGFGYRAKYIAETARTIANDRPAGWLLSLRNPASAALETKPIAALMAHADEEGDQQPSSSSSPPPTYKTAHEQLLQLCGVGPKVADCVSLMGLGWGEAVPVDTHVWQIAMRDYKFGGKSKNKTLTKAMYDAVGDHFRSLWGCQAGWAHSVLFTADLRTFSDRVVIKKAEQAKEEVKGDVSIIIKTEVSEQVTLATPVSTPSKRTRQTVKSEEFKIKAEESLDDPVSTVRTSKRRKTKRNAER